MRRTIETMVLLAVVAAGGRETGALDLVGQGSRVDHRLLLKVQNGKQSVACGP